MSCPICFCEKSDAVQFVRAPCAHEFCRSCLEQHLLAPQPTTPTPTGDNPYHFHDSKLTPTLNLCPLCRADVSWFDLVLLGNGTCSDKPIYNPEDHPWPDFLSKGAIYVPTRSGGSRNRAEGIGKASLHIDPFESVPNRVYYNVATVPNSLKLADEPDHHHFDRLYYHAPTQTFQGEIDQSDQTRYPRTSLKYSKLTMILTFSANGHFVKRGLVVKKFRVYDSVDAFLESFPMDGTWKVVGESQSCNETTATISRNLAMKSMNGTVYPYLLDGLSTPISLIGPVHEMNMRTIYGDWESADVCVFRDGEHVHEKWTRVNRVTSIDHYPSDTATCIGQSSSGGYQRLLELEATNTQQPPRYHSDTLWGNVFCQGFRVGLASYHFVSEENAYISYEHIDVTRWPPLDNGVPVPSQVQFKNVSIRPYHGTDEPQTIFSGQIRWLDDYGSTWQGSLLWDYEMVFDSKFLCIIGGRVHSTRRRSEEESTEEMNIYGESLVYCNAALFSMFRLRSDVTTYAPESRALRKHLLKAQASVRSIGQVHTVMTRAFQPEALNPVDLGIYGDDNDESDEEH